jgi:TolB-like protein/Tfp pilus assembly protein PilF
VYFAWDKFTHDAASHSAEKNIITSSTEPDHGIQQVETTESDQESNVPDKKSIAVLPFVNMSSDTEQEFFSDGLSEELLNLLAKIPDLRVAARTSSFSFKGQNLEIPQIASRLNVAHVLEGSVRKSGNQLRITAQLIRADNGYHLWSETYDRQLDNVFQIQDDIAAAVVDALKITLLGAAPTVRETDPEAYQLFLEGQFIRRQISASTIPKAIDLFKKALEIDPDYAPAWAELAYAYLWNAGIGDMPIDEGNMLADQAIARALEIDPDYAWTYFVRGVTKLFNKFEFVSGAEDYQLALQLDPGNAYLIGANAGSARVLGRFDEAIELYKTSLELDPLMTELRSWQALAFQYMGLLEQAENAYRTTLALSPDFSSAHYRLGRVLLGQGRSEEALAEMEREASRVYHNTGLAMAHHVLGNHEASRLALDTLINEDADSAAFQIAEVYSYHDDPDKAFEWLERSLVIRDSGLAGILGNPAFLGLRTDPRWQAFLEKLGLLEFWLDMPEKHGGPVQ